MTPAARPFRAHAALALVIALLAIGGLAACTPATGNPTQSATGVAATPPSVAATRPSAAATPATVATPAPATEAPTAAPSADVTAPIEVRDFELDPTTVVVSGSTIGLAVTNAGPTVHNVTVRDDAGTILLGSRNLRDGESETVVGAIAPGTYVLFCSLPGHESLGMKGTLTVTAP